jgi:hypothetical protein
MVQYYKKQYDEAKKRKVAGVRAAADEAKKAREREEMREITTAQQVSLTSLP